MFSTFVSSLKFLSLAFALILVGTLTGCATEMGFGTANENLTQGALENSSGSVDGNTDGTAGDKDKSGDDDDDDDDDYANSSGDKASNLNSCAQLMNVAPEKVVVAGESNVHTLSADKVLLVKVAGSRNQVNLSFQSSGPMVPGFCVVVVGSANSVEIKVNGNLKRVSFFGAGSSNKSDIRMQPNSRVYEPILVGLAGNNNEVKVGGPGQYLCPVGPRIEGTANVLACQ